MEPADVEAIADGDSLGNVDGTAIADDEGIADGDSLGNVDGTELGP